LLSAAGLAQGSADSCCSPAKPGPGFSTVSSARPSPGLAASRFFAPKTSNEPVGLRQEGRGPSGAVRPTHPRRGKRTVRLTHRICAKDGKTHAGCFLFTNLPSSGHSTSD